ncbi:MAG: hypothetical protein ACOH1Y_18390 [Propionicimonas sp.]
MVFLPKRSTEFARIGWAEADWDALDDVGTWAGVNVDRHLCVRRWLRDAPERFEVPVSPAVARETFAVYGQRTPQVLNALAGGATARFVDAYLTLWGADVDTAWTFACQVGLAEPEAVGWAHTDRLVISKWVGKQPHILRGSAIRPWLDRFGPVSYLWVLAGFTLDETAAMVEGGATVSEGQLRVMAALNGVSLPAGI